MLVHLLEISFYSLLTAFCVVKGVALFDFLLDYKQYWWKVRYKLAHRAARHVGMAEKLEKKLKEAHEAGADGVNVMVDIYNQIAHKHYPFKLWTCIYCMTLRFGLIVILWVCALLLFQGYAWCTLAYFFTSVAAVSALLKI